MSIEATKNKIKKAEEEIEKQRQILREKGAKLMEESGLLDLPISDKDLKKELKALCDKLKKK